MMMKYSYSMTMNLLVIKAAGNKSSSQFTRLMMKKAAAPYLRIRGNNFTTVPAAATAKTTTKTTTPATKGGRKPETLVGPGLGDPCLDLFFGVQEHTPKSVKYRLLKQILPAAWSHDPLTTLKLICNLRDFGSSDFGKCDHESFYRAAVWLHHNHPKTLASNVLPMFFYDSNHIGSPSDLAEILNRLTKSGTRISESEDCRLLHDISDILVDRLRRNIQDMNKQKPLHHFYHLFAMDAILPLLGESIAKKLFPRESYPEYQGLEESLYVNTVRDRLRDEVVAPLIAYGEGQPMDSKFGKKSYLPEYLEGAAAGTLLPYEIVRFAYHFSSDLAQLHWARIVKDVYLKQGKFRNCLVVCNTEDCSKGCEHCYVTLSLAVLVSQLSGGPWKGKVISSGPNPELRDLPGSDLDLVSNCAFLTRTMRYGFEVDIPKVFDLILEAAENANLPPDQMVRKVFLVDCDDAQIPAEDSWESDYQAILTKYKEKGYAQDAVPQIVLWNIDEDDEILKAPRSRPGLTTLTGFSYYLFESFLDNGGQFGPHHFVEAATCEPVYQNLVVVD